MKLIKSPVNSSHDFLLLKYRRKEKSNIYIAQKTNRLALISVFIQADTFHAMYDKTVRVLMKNYFAKHQ
jgi:hypothetical protein